MVNSQPVEQRTSRGSKTLKPVPRRIAPARERNDAGNGKRVTTSERRHGSLERESPEGESLGVPARRNKLARHRGEKTAGRLRKPEGGRRRRVGTRRDGGPTVLTARKGNEPHGRSCPSLRRGRAAGWFRHTLEADRSPREDEPRPKSCGDGDVAKTPRVAGETRKAGGGAPKPMGC